MSRIPSQILVKYWPYSSKIQIFDLRSSQILGHYLTYYSTPNNGQIANIFWIARRGRVFAEVLSLDSNHACSTLIKLKASSKYFLPSKQKKKKTFCFLVSMGPSHKIFFHRLQIRDSNSLNRLGQLNKNFFVLLLKDRLQYRFKLVLKYWFILLKKSNQIYLTRALQWVKRFIYFCHFQTGQIIFNWIKKYRGDLCLDSLTSLSRFLLKKFQYSGDLNSKLVPYLNGPK